MVLSLPEPDTLPDVMSLYDKRVGGRMGRAGYAILEHTLSELPAPVANRIIKHLEWRLDVGLDACYQDYFKPDYHSW